MVQPPEEMPGLRGARVRVYWRGVTPKGEVLPPVWQELVFLGSAHGLLCFWEARTLITFWCPADRVLEIQLQEEVCRG